MAIEHEAIKLGELELVYAPNIDMYSMTEAWKHEGSDPNKKPILWLRQQWTQNYIKTLQENGLQNSDLKSLFASMGCKGTYANWMVFLAYAQYLSPKLHVIVNEYFTRIYSGDVTLIEEIYNQANEAGKRFIEIRMKGKITRREFTDTLKEHGVTGDGYRQCTNAIYEGTLQKNAVQLRQEYHLTPRTNIREHLSSLQLSAVDISESQSCEKIKKYNDTGNVPCANRALQVSKIVGASMAELQKQLDSI